MKVSINANGYLIYGSRESKTDPEYDNLIRLIQSKPEPIPGHEWMLKYPEMEWDSVGVEDDPEEEVTAEEIAAAIEEALA